MHTHCHVKLPASTALINCFYVEKQELDVQAGMTRSVFVPVPALFSPSHTDTRPPPTHTPVSPFHLLSFLQQTWPRNQTVQPLLCRMTFRRRVSPGWRSARHSGVPSGRSIRFWTAAGPSAPSWSFSRTGLQTCGWLPNTISDGSTGGSLRHSFLSSFRLWWCRCSASDGSPTITRTPTGAARLRLHW